MKHSKALFIVVLGALFLVGLRSEDLSTGTATLSAGTADSLFRIGTGDSTIHFGPDAVLEIAGPESISAKLSEIEGKTLRELEEMVKELGARLKLAQETHDQELRRIGAAKFPSQFGLAGRLDTLKDFSEIRWSPRTPSCQSRRFQGAWVDDITSIPDHAIVPLELSDGYLADTTTLGRLEK